MTSDLQHCDVLIINAQLASVDDAATTPYGALLQHAVGISDGQISLIEPMADVNLDGFQGQLIDAQDGWITPGLIDSHTHLLHGGQRANEFEKRLQGVSYAEIAKQGGGILSTVTATRSLSQAQLVEQALPRLQALIDEGVTTVEIKSGYGLTVADELKMLRAARQLQAGLPVRLRTTLLAAHSCPPEYKDDPDAYIDLICSELIPRVADERLAEAVDVFCETIAFNPAQTERVFQAAREAGLGIKAHVEQLSNLHGAALAARYQAWSVDHLEYLDQPGIDALKQSGTTACLLPGAFYFLRERKLPPVEALRQAGVPIALASDLNPGSSPLASLRLMMNMGCILFGMTPEEALRGVTLNAARALGLEQELGSLTVGKRADLLIWDIEEPAQLAYEFGVPRLRQRIFDGQVAPLRSSTDV